MALAVRLTVGSLLVVLFFAGAVSADCLSPYGYKYTGAGTNSITVVDVTGVFLVKNDMSNFNCSHELGKYAAHKISVDTSPGKETVNCFVYDSRANITRPSNTTVPDAVLTPSDSDFSMDYMVYDFNFKFEGNDSNWSFPGNVSQLLNVICDDYSTVQIDLASYNSSFILSTRQHPVLELKVGESLIRRLTITASNQIVYFYIPADFDSTLVENFELRDQTMMWRSSILEISKIQNDIPKVIDSRQWMDDATIQGVYLVKDDEYKIVLRYGSSSQDKGKYTFPINATRQIYVTQGIFTTPSQSYPGLTYGFWGNLSTGNVYASYQVPTGSIILATFRVFNCSSSADACIGESYSSTSTSDSATFAYPVSNVSWSYLVNLQIEYGSYHFNQSRVVELTNTTNALIGSIPGGTLFGFTWMALITFIIFIQIIWVAVQAHQLNVSFAALAIALELMFVTYFGLIELAYGLLVLSVFILALLLRINASRRGFG